MFTHLQYWPFQAFIPIQSVSYLQLRISDQCKSRWCQTVILKNHLRCLFAWPGYIVDVFENGGTPEVGVRQKPVESGITHAGGE